MQSEIAVKMTLKECDQSPCWLFVSENLGLNSLSPPSPPLGLFAWEATELSFSVTAELQNYMEIAYSKLCEPRLSG